MTNPEFSFCHVQFTLLHAALHNVKVAIQLPDVASQCQVTPVNTDYSHSIVNEPSKASTDVSFVVVIIVDTIDQCFLIIDLL